MNDILNKLADRYFDGLTSPAEEALLAELLSKTKDDEYQDIKAVMGYFLTQKKNRQAKVRRVRFVASALAVAAAATLLIATTFTGSQSGICEGWVNGERITDNVSISNTAHQQLTDFFNESSEFDNNVDEVFGLMANE